MTPEDIETIVRTAIADLPEEIQAGLDQVQVIIAENHTDAVLPTVEGVFPADFKGCYIGTIIEGSEEDVDESGVPVNPPVGAIYLNAENLVSQDDVHTVLFHEIGHVMGLSEEEVENLGMTDPNE